MFFLMTAVNTVQSLAVLVQINKFCLCIHIAIVIRVLEVQNKVQSIFMLYDRPIWQREKSMPLKT